MDYCLLEDAFKVDSIQGSTEKAQKYEKKKIKRTKDCNKSFDPKFNPQATDPDRPALVAKEYVEAFQNVSAKLPEIPNAISKKSLPNYFVGNEDDDTNLPNVEGFTSNFSAVDEKGFDKAGGSSLPIPSVNDVWKPITPSTSNTAFFESLPTPGGTYPIWNNNNTIKSEPRDVSEQLKGSDTYTSLNQKIDDLMKRLEELEKGQTIKATNQQEIIAFVGTGIFFIFALSILKK